MAEPVSVQACIDRHTAYPFDIATRLKPLQVQRMTEMCAPVRAGETVLDVGCNSGYIVDFLPAGCEAWGVDVAPDLVTKARGRLARADVAPAEALPFPDQSVDVVVLGEILEHVYDPVSTLQEAKRVAKRLVIGSTPHESSAWGPGQGRGPETHRFHVRCFTAETLMQAIEQAGFVAADVQTIVHEGQPVFYRFEALCG